MSAHGSTGSEHVQGDDGAHTGGHVVDAELVVDAPGEWVLVSEAAELAGVSRSLIRKWYSKGRLPHREVEGPTGRAYEVPLERVHQLAREQSQRARTAEVSTSDVVRREDFDAWVDRLQRTFHGIAQELADARERAGVAETRAQAADARARIADEAADKLRAEVERLRQVELEAERLRTQVGERSRRWWRKAG